MRDKSRVTDTICVTHGVRDLRLITPNSDSPYPPVPLPLWGEGFYRRRHPPMQKSLDRKLAAIHADPSGAKDFIIADAKDADMAYGIGAPGKSPESHAGEARLRTLAEYRDQIRQIVRQGLVDIMLMSASTSDVLAIQERLFADSHITPAARANDTSDVFVVRGGSYSRSPRPFRTATLDHIQCGHMDCGPTSASAGADLGLYSMTFNNRLDEDLVALEAIAVPRGGRAQRAFGTFWKSLTPTCRKGSNRPRVGGGNS